MSGLEREKKFQKISQVFLFSIWPGQGKSFQKFYKCFYLVSGLDKEKSLKILQVFLFSIWLEQGDKNSKNFTSLFI